MKWGQPIPCANVDEPFARKQSPTVSSFFFLGCPRATWSLPEIHKNLLLLLLLLLIFAHMLILWWWKKPIKINDFGWVSLNRWSQLLPPLPSYFSNSSSTNYQPHFIRNVHIYILHFFRFRSQFTIKMAESLEYYVCILLAKVSSSDEDSSPFLHLRERNYCSQITYNV